MKHKFITLLFFIAGLFSQSAIVYVFDEHVDVATDGNIQGVQMTLVHEEDFSIELESCTCKHEPELAPIDPL